MRSIDIHAHLMPQSLWRAVDAGRDWYGTTYERGEGLGTTVTHGRRSRVPHVSYLGDTDLGADANIGAGTITANFDGQNKNRTEIGDGAFVGVDTMLVAPVKLGKGARTGAGSVVTKDIPDGATAVGVPARVVRRKKLTTDSDSDAS